MPQTATALTQTAMDRVDQEIGITGPALWAVMTVETRGCGFLPDRRPQILFERHIFHARTQGRFDAQAPDLSNPVPGGYGAGGAAQYDRLDRAIQLDREAALESASWGLGQVMGFNAADAGYANVEAMVAAMYQSEDAQLGAMMGFIKTNSLAPYLQSADWAGFAQRYNGSNFKKNDYDGKLARAYTRYLAGPLPSLDVRAAQLYLTYLGYAPGGVDGWFGNNTQKALIKFQTAQGMPPTGQLDAGTLDQLRQAL